MNSEHQSSKLLSQIIEFGYFSVVFDIRDDMTSFCNKNVNINLSKLEGKYQSELSPTKIFLKSFFVKKGGGSHFSPCELTATPSH